MPTCYCQELTGIRSLPRYLTPERQRFLRDNSFLDEAILADELGMSIRTIHRWMLKLRLRKYSHG